MADALSTAASGRACRALHEADAEAEKRGEIEEGLTREEFAAGYAKYLPAR